MAREAVRKRRRRTKAISKDTKRVGVYLSPDIIKKLDELIQKLNIGLSSVVSIAIDRFHNQEPLVRAPVVVTAPKKRVRAPAPSNGGETRQRKRRKRGSVQTILFDLESSNGIDTTRISNT